MSNQSTKDRMWQVDGDPFSVETDDDLAAAIHEATAILTRIGGAMVILADREQVAPDMWATTRFLFKWTSYAPGRRRPEEVPAEPDVAAVA